jgi:hypothetical protein
MLLFEVPLCIYQSNQTEVGKNRDIHDINIEWSNSVNDKLAKMYPELRKAKLRTSSIDVALTMATAESCRLILPKTSHAFLDDKIRQTLLQFDTYPLEQEVKVPLYLNQLKSQKNVGLEDVTDFITSGLS